MAATNPIETAPGALCEPAELAGGNPVSATGHCRLTFPMPCRKPAPCGLPCELKLGPERHAVVNLGHLARMAVMALPGEIRLVVCKGRQDNLDMSMSPLSPPSLKMKELRSI